MELYFQCYLAVVVFSESYNPVQNVGTISKSQLKIPPPPLLPCNVVMLLCLSTVQMISVALNIAREGRRGGGGCFQEIAMTVPLS